MSAPKPAGRESRKSNEKMEKRRRRLYPTWYPPPALCAPATEVKWLRNMERTGLEKLLMRSRMKTFPVVCFSKQ
jgi:hypothetical protein